MVSNPLILASLLAASASPMAQADASAPQSGPCASCDAADPETPDAAACRLADLLENTFVFPSQGKAYAAMLRRKVAAGDYAKLAHAEAALAMTRDLQAVAADGHLWVRMDEDNPASAGAQAPRNFPPVIEQAGWIAPEIAFIRINAFLSDEKQTADVAQFMASHADAKALIFDVRAHGGGGLAQMDVIFPWLFSEETRLVTMAIRRSVEEDQGAPFAPSETLRLLEGTQQETMREHWALPNDDPRLRDARIYVLTSGRTNSAAEHFAFAMKRTGRARLVGETTAGGNHFGGQVSLPAGLAAFVSVGRTFDPVTGQDWEGVGVAPDVASPPESALAKALVELGVPETEALVLGERYTPDAARMKRRKRAGR